MKFDYLIVGSGLTGSIIARDLSDAGCSVLVIERRLHLGGNVHDQTHSSGIVFHTYGPHYFRTNDDEIWEYVNKFAKFYKYEPALKSYVDGKYENWPIAASYIKEKVGSAWSPGFEGSPKNFEEASLGLMPRVVYEKFVKGYTEKQWGVPCSMLSATLARRFDVRDDDEPRLMRHKYQGIPEKGYANFVHKILEGIPIAIGFDYLKQRDRFQASKKIIYTGPIDQFFSYSLGKLKYRGQKRTHIYHSELAYIQPCGQVNYPSPDVEQIRVLEWKHMMPIEAAQKIKGTLITKEITYSPDEPDSFEYPFPDEENATLYAKYRALADNLPNVVICGRLGEYRYYDMDQAIARARMIARKILAESGTNKT